MKQKLNIAMIKQKSCKGQGKAFGYGCGKLTNVEKFILFFKVKPNSLNFKGTIDITVDSPND